MLRCSEEICIVTIRTKPPAEKEMGHPPLYENKRLQGPTFPGFHTPCVTQRVCEQLITALKPFPAHCQHYQPYGEPFPLHWNLCSSVHQVTETGQGGAAIA